MGKKTINLFLIIFMVVGIGCSKKEDSKKESLQTIPATQEAIVGIWAPIKIIQDGSELPEMALKTQG